jgi:glycosyltransferase involved in cell wall biosynthesis
VTTPLVSVLIPARNAVDTIEPALRSVRAQTLGEWEAVIIDDGSTDATASVVSRLAQKDKRIGLLSHAHEGIVGALNRGLAACGAPLVARFDADDLMHRDRLRLQVEMLARRPELSGVGSLVRCFPRRTLRAGMRRYEAWLNSMHEPDAIARERFIESPLVHPSVMVRREVLAAARWRDEPWPEDWELWLRLMEAGHRFAKVPEVLLYWRDSAARLTRTQSRYMPERLVELRAHYLARGPLKGREPVIWGAGEIGKKLARALNKVGAPVRAFIDIDPRKIGQRIHGARVLAPPELLAPNGVTLLAAVGAPQARGEIRAAAVAAGFVEGVDFYACA